jgi:lactate 2-monooxygenase
MSAPFSSYAAEIYLHGMGGTRPPFTTDLASLEDQTREVLAAEPFGYVAGAAGSGSTARANLAAFDDWKIVPRMLTNSGDRDHSVSVLGTSMPAPVVLAPVGVQSIVHPDGELASARAAAELGLTVIMSTASSYTIEEVAEANGSGSRWYQLYWPNDPDVCVSFLSRAKAAGFSTLVLTLDTWMLGWRPTDLDHAYLPFLQGKGLAVYFSDPAFRAGLAKPPEEDLPAALMKWFPIFSGTDHSWDQLAFLREYWDGPIVLKGVQHADDARRAVDAGVQGLVVSNHGGRQVDGAIGSLSALPGIARAVGDQLTVLFDSGVRTGSDVVKALALGAQAVLVGRPWMYGLAHGGQDGVRHVLRTLLADYDLAMGLSGHRRPSDLSPADLIRSCEPTGRART